MLRDLGWEVQLNLLRAGAPSLAEEHPPIKSKEALGFRGLGFRVSPGPRVYVNPMCV